MNTTPLLDDLPPPNPSGSAVERVHAVMAMLATASTEATVTIGRMSGKMADGTTYQGKAVILAVADAAGDQQRVPFREDEARTLLQTMQELVSAHPNDAAAPMFQRLADRIAAVLS